MINLTKELQLLGSEIPPGTSKRFRCLKCRGGSTEEKSLSITKDKGLLLYNCFRDTCTFSGKIRETTGEIVAKNFKPPRSYKRELFALSREDLQFFWNSYKLEEEDLVGVRRCLGEELRYLLPIYGPEGQLRGHILRSYNGGLKAITYNTRPDQPFIGWFHPLHDGETDQVVVVEDWFSACKVAKAGLSALSLNGTHISWDGAVEIAENTSKVILALDRGTLPTMMGHIRKYRGLWDSYQIWMLNKDLKYEEEQIINAASNRKEIIVRVSEGSPGI